MATFNGAALLVSLFACIRKQQMVAFPLMVPFAVVVAAVLGQDARQRPLAEQDYFGQAFLFDRTNPTFRECIQVWALGRERNRSHSARCQC